MRWPWKKPQPPCADPLVIAVLEYELFGIEPKPGNTAAFAVGLHRAGRVLAGERVRGVDFPAEINGSGSVHY